MDAPKQGDPFTHVIIETPSWDDCHQFVRGHYIGICYYSDAIEHESTPQYVSAVIKIFNPQAQVDFQLFCDGNFILDVKADGLAFALFHIPQITTHCIRFAANQKLFVGPFRKQADARLHQLFFCSPFELRFNCSNIKLPVPVTIRFEHKERATWNGWISPDNARPVGSNSTCAEILSSPVPGC